MADSLIESLRGQGSLSLEAPEVQKHAVLNGILQVTDPCEPGSSRVQMHHVLNETLREKDKSEHSAPGRSRDANG